MFKEDQLRKVEEEKKKRTEDLSKILCETPERLSRFTTVSDLEMPRSLAAWILFPLFILRASRIYPFSTSSRTIPWAGMNSFNSRASVFSSLSITFTTPSWRANLHQGIPYLPKEIKLMCLESFPSLIMKILDSTLGR